MPHPAQTDVAHYPSDFVPQPSPGDVTPYMQDQYQQQQPQQYYTEAYDVNIAASPTLISSSSFLVFAISM